MNIVIAGKLVYYLTISKGAGEKSSAPSFFISQLILLHFNLGGKTYED